MLTSLSAKNFKSWESIDEMRLAPITGLFGTNSSGKTSILQLLLLLKQTAASTDRGQVLDFGDEQSLVSLGGFHDVAFAHESSRSLEISLKWTEPTPFEVVDPANDKTLFASSELAFETRIDGSADETLQVAEFGYSVGTNRFGMRRQNGKTDAYDLTADAGKFQFRHTKGRPWPLPQPVKSYGFPDQVRAYYKNADFLSELELAFESLLARTYYLGPLREDPRRRYTWTGGQPDGVGKKGERVIEAMLASQTRKQLISFGKGIKKRTLEEQTAVLLQRLGLIESFRVKRVARGLYEVLVRRSPGSSEVLITDVGFGVSQVLPVLVLPYYVPEGSVIVLEQPEIHLHPSVQAGLADVLIEAARLRRVQFIVESHSEHLLQRLQLRIAESQIDANQVALYFCDIEDGRSRLNELELDVFGNIRNWPRDFFGDPFGEIAAMAIAASKRQGPHAA